MLAVLMMLQAMPMTVFAATTPPATNTPVEEAPTTSVGGYTVTERENKNGSKTTVFELEDTTVEITTYENYQVIVERNKNESPKIAISMKRDVKNIMAEVPTDLGKHFKTNWLNVTYTNGEKEFVFAKYDSDNKILSFEMKTSGTATIIDDYVTPDKEDDKPSGDACAVTKRENKNGSVSLIVVNGKKVTEITTYEDYEVVVALETGKTPNIKVCVDDDVKTKTVMVEAPINLAFSTRAGYVLATYADDGKQEYIYAKYDNGSKILHFEIAESATVEIVDNFPSKKPVTEEEVKKLPFKDVTDSDWYYEAVQFVYEKGIMVGTSDVTFAPSQTITRAMVVTMLHRMEGKPLTNNKITFKDVEDGTWYTEAIRWANKAGIVSGYSEDTFGTNDAITREQMLVILYRYAMYKKIDVKLDKDAEKMAFNDNDKIADWVRPAAEWAYANGIVKGANTYLMPKDNATRAMTASMFQSFISNILK